MLWQQRSIHVGPVEKSEGTAREASLGLGKVEKWRRNAIRGVNKS